MAKNRKTTEIDSHYLTWYRSGFLDAENKYQQIVKYLEYENELLNKRNARLSYENELFKKTNVRLFEDLQRVEKDKPRVMGVLITYKLANCFITNAKRGKRNHSLADKLSKKVKEAQAQDAEAQLLSIKENGQVEL